MVLSNSSTPDAFGDDLPRLEAFDEAQLTDATERMIRKSLLARRVRVVLAFIIGVIVGVAGTIWCMTR